VIRVEISESRLIIDVVSTAIANDPLALVGRRRWESRRRHAPDGHAHTTRVAAPTAHLSALVTRNRV
jgi:hypothetical protein